MPWPQCTEPYRCFQSSSADRKDEKHRCGLDDTLSLSCSDSCHGPVHSWRELTPNGNDDAIGRFREWHSATASALADGCILAYYMSISLDLGLVNNLQVPQYMSEGLHTSLRATFRSPFPWHSLLHRAVAYNFKKIGVLCGQNLGV